eukprot:TRINITY_DN5401_c0_g1_i2.p1 TRINITY_DN5401_c0_g1~~TRINITY_DN5401_c0_g1_i2.p1  ORF type:complete len:764 (-),score=124.10 TRINITY_DN5401_c0_g1_i2:119-2410(-)
MHHGGRGPPAPLARIGAPLPSSRNNAVVQAYPAGSVVGQQQQQLQRQMGNWPQNRPSLAAPPQAPRSDNALNSGPPAAATPSSAGSSGKPYANSGPSMMPGGAPMTASAAAPAGSAAGRQVRVNPRPSLQVPLQQAASSSAGRAAGALTSPRRTASPAKQHSAATASSEPGAANQTSRMRYSSAGPSNGPSTGRAVVLTTSQQEAGQQPGSAAAASPAAVNSCAASNPSQRPGVAGKASACAGGPGERGVRNGAFRSSSTLEGSPRRFRGACERALSVGVCVGEGPSLSRGASSSSALPLASQAEANGPIRRSSAGSGLMASSTGLTRQRSGRRPGSGSPPRGHGDCSGRPGVLPQGPPSSRGTPGRKSIVSIAVTGAGSTMDTSHQPEPEAEAEPALFTPAMVTGLSHDKTPSATCISAAAEATTDMTGADLTQAVNLSLAAAAAQAGSKPRLNNCTPAVVDDQSSGNLLLHVQLLPSEIIKWKDVHIVKAISMGSFGEVSLARYRGQEVSVKRCLLGANNSMTAEQLRNLEREINTYRTLDHPHIVSYIGCILEHPNLAIVTEYVPNGNLFDLLFMHRVNLKASIRLKIASQVAVAVAYMHNCEPTVIHRDLKTQNLVLDQNYSIKVCDFGKTQEIGAHGLMTGQDTGGSPRYMAPECFKLNTFITEKVDIWSLGCCLVEILGGPLPYEDVPQMSEVQKLLSQGIPPLVPPWFTPQTQAMLSKCFEFDPSRRIVINEVLICLRRLTPEELERHGMDKRRVR